MKAVTVTAPLEKCQCYCTHCKWKGNFTGFFSFLLRSAGTFEPRHSCFSQLPAPKHKMQCFFVILDIKYLVNNQILCSATAVSLGKSKNYWTSPLSDSIFALWLQKAGLCSVHTAGPASHILHSPLCSPRTLPAAGSTQPGAIGCHNLFILLFPVYLLKYRTQNHMWRKIRIFSSVLLRGTWPRRRKL